MKRKTIYILFTGILIFTGCKKYLDAKPNAVLTTTDNLPALQAVLDNGSYMNDQSPSFDEASADDYFLVQDNYNSLTPIVQQAYIWNTAGRNDYTFSETPEWANLYHVVYCSNLCLDALNNLKKTAQNTDAWNNIKGSSLFFRGRSFLQLAWIFSKAYDSSSASKDLGIAIRLTSDFNVPSKRSNVGDTYKQILNDLKASVDYLPLYPQNPLRPSKLAAYGYLARTFLSMRLYDSAYKYSNKFLQIDSSLMDYNNLSEVNLNSDYPFSEFNKEVVHEYYDNSFVIYSLLYASIDTTLYKSYQDNDIRKQAYFIFSGDIDNIGFRGSYSGGTQLFTGIATDEMYLVRSECEAHSNKITSAMNDLNALLVKRWKSGTFQPYTASNQVSALNIILAERRKELVFRDLRWIDIKRLNKEGANISIKRVINGQTYTLPPNDNRFAIPLPTDIINLTGMKQNPQ